MFRNQSKSLTLTLPLLKVCLFVSACLLWLIVVVVVGLFFRSFWHWQVVLCKPKIIHRWLTFSYQISGPPAFLTEDAAEWGIIRAEILLINSFFFFFFFRQQAQTGKKLHVSNWRFQNKKEYFSGKSMQSSPSSCSGKTLAAALLLCLPIAS